MFAAFLGYHICEAGEKGAAIVTMLESLEAIIMRILTWMMSTWW